MSSMKPCELSRLKSILDDMVEQSRITENEAEAILNKAGMSISINKLGVKEWIDEEGTVYKFGNE